ncbi:hypothetical protein ACO0LV_06490 [Pseudactinotalea sp. Z1739]
MEPFLNAALGVHVVRAPQDPPEWDLIHPRDRTNVANRRIGRPRRGDVPG